MDENKKSYKFVYAIIEKGEGAESKTYWQKCGIAYTNRDQSITLKLDTLPINGKLQIRERDESRDRWNRRDGHEQRSEAAPQSLDFGAIQ